jgi:transposase
MNVLRAFKTELDLNNRQQTACARHAGAARWAYNWGLARKIEAYSVSGLVTPLDEIVPSHALPQMVETVLLPYKGTIVLMACFPAIT